MIKSHKDEQLVKVLTGIRHCGKSYLLAEFIDELKAAGIDEDHIIRLNLENSVFSGIRTAKDIEKFVCEKMKPSGKSYLFVDEIQTISGWERAINSLFLRRKLDIYIASSSAAVLSKKARMRAEKKFVEINLKTLSFTEYKNNFSVAWKKGCGLLNRAIAIRNAAESQFTNYICAGGFPATVVDNAELRKVHLNDIYSSILFRDVVRRFNIRNIDLLERIIKYFFENIGKENSVQRARRYLEKHRYKKNLSLVYSYVRALEDAFILKRIYRYNFLTGKQLRTNIAYFIEDHALLNAVMPINADNENGVYANILVNELQRRSFNVHTGKIETDTIDFFAVHKDQTLFIQTIKTDDDISVIDKKLETLSRLNDLYTERQDKKEMNTARYLIFFDPEAIWEDSPDDIIFIKLYDFLLLPTFFE
ncbi:ATPase [Spirochaetia bacterium]|nr:ATPase [Spirochaetia bacterium]